jgi:hypothetical protein
MKLRGHSCDGRLQDALTCKACTSRKIANCIPPAVNVRLPADHNRACKAERGLSPIASASCKACSVRKASAIHYKPNPWLRDALKAYNDDAARTRDGLKPEAA